MSQNSPANVQFLSCARMRSRVKHLVSSVCIYICIYVYVTQKMAVLYFGDNKLSQKLVYCLLLRFYMLPKILFIASEPSIECQIKAFLLTRLGPGGPGGSSSDSTRLLRHTRAHSW